MNFAEAMNNEARHTYTENGAKAMNSTSNACLDMFGSIGSLRMRSTTDAERIFAEAYKEDQVLATKILFYARDIREGCGERKVFRDLVHYCAIHHPEAIRSNIDLFGFYGRYDDLYALVDTPLENEMWVAMKKQLNNDIHSMNNGMACSLLAKWIKTPDASSPNTRQLGIKTALKLGYKVKDFKRILRQLRKYIDVVECHMSANEWSAIQYPSVPSRAMLLYRNAFIKHDEDRFHEFVTKAITGEVKIHSGDLYPYDIVSKIYDCSWGGHKMHNLSDDEKSVLEAQWRQLPDYIKTDVNALVISDTSGSMTCLNGLPMASSIGLAIYFAEHNRGAYRNMFIPFASSASVVKITGETLEQKILSILNSDSFGYCGHTNLESAFKKVLSIAVENRIPKEEMVKSLIIISDMEIDGVVGWSPDNWSFYDTMTNLYAAHGYEIPNVVFWNVNSRHNVFHADACRKGVQLCSGQSTTTFKNLMSSIGMTPIEMMLKVINSERYSEIIVK